jgi:uncharacterized membrane protein
MLLVAHAPILLAWIILAWIAYDQLPERIPTHFDASGTPNGYMERSIASWFLLPLVGAISALTIAFSSIYTGRNPNRWNVPNKQAFLALNDAQRQPIVEMMNTLMAAISLGTLLFLATLHFDSWRIVSGTSRKLSLISFFTLGILLAVGIIGGIVFTMRFRRMLREAAQSATSGATRAHSANDRTSTGRP